MSSHQPGQPRAANVTRPSGLRSAGNRERAVGVLLVVVAATSAAAGALWWLTAQLLVAGRSGGTTFDEAVGLAAVIGSWICVGWFGLGLTVAAAAGAPGALGRSCARTAEVLAPWTVRRLVATALGLTVVTGPAAAAAVPAELSAASSAAAVVQLDQRARLGIHPAASAPGTQLDQRAVPTRMGADLPPLDRPAAEPYAVTVRSGDCLWSIAGRHLGPQASDAEIAAAWPRWYTANRDLIGPDPNLLHPGQQLVAPH